MDNLSFKLFYACVVYFLLFFVSISCVDGAQCSEHKSKIPEDGELLETVGNVETFGECCDFCSAHKNCSLFFYAYLAEDCQLWNSTSFKEAYDFGYSCGNVMPDGWSPSTMRPTTITPIPDCPPDNTNPSIQRPDEYDCTKYHVCILGTWLPMQCDAHLWYDYLELRCRSSNLFCYPDSFVPTYEPTTTEGITTDTAATNSTQATTTSQTEATTTTTTQGTTTEFANPCPPSGSLNVSHPTDCSKYVRCTQGIPVTMQCPNGENFDVLSGKCTSPDEAVCFTTLPTSTATVTPTTMTTSAETSQTEVTTVTQATTTSQTEVTTTTQGTTTEFVNPCPPSGSLNVSHPTDCSKYVRCTQGIPVTMQCPNGENFDVVSGKCTSPDEAVCFTTLPTSAATTVATDSTTPATMTTPITTAIPTTTTPTTTTPATATPTTTNPISTSTRKPEECPATGIVSIPHPSDCTKYIYCVQGVNAGERTCGSGQKFDNETRKCVAEAEAECWNEVSRSFPTLALFL